MRCHKSGINGPKVNIISLGCSKNLVDSERLMKMLEDAGCRVEFESDQGADIAVINTCGFIGDAKEESIDTIMQHVDAKSRGLIKKVYVMGCLSERYRDDLIAEIPEIDGFYGKFDWSGLVEEIASQHPQTRDDKVPFNTSMYGRKVTTGPSPAFVKIAEGCNR